MNTKEIVLKPEFEKAIFDLGFSEFTEIQEKCIPLIQQGKDVIGSSYTGSGKTVAFGFPALEKVTPGKGIQLLVIVPTRELCNQVAKEFAKFTKYRRTYIVEVYGGVSINYQIENLRRADVVVCTPGRMLDHLRRGTINLSKVNILILDEADKMFEMGFIDDVKTIISYVPSKRQTLLFGATVSSDSSDILDIVRHYMHNPEKVKMPAYVDKNKLVQHYYDIEQRDKFSLCLHLIKTQSNGLCIVFCGTKHMVDVLARNISKHGLKVLPLHGNLTQSRRKQTVDAFHRGEIDALIASDVAARGLDIKNVNLIINYDIPRTSKDYVHRIGRTARAGCEGKVISLLSHHDHDNFRRVLEDRSLLIHEIKTPYFERVEFIRPQHHDRQFRRRFPRNRRW